jgi:cytochrome c553
MTPSGGVLALRLLASLSLLMVVAHAQGPGGQAPAGPQTTPPWAYTVATPAPPAAPGAGAAPAQPVADAPKTVPGSSASFTTAQIRDGFNIADWHPGDHPPMPEIVKNGRRPDVRACGYCHQPNGQGRPENSAIVGLPVNYFMQQMADFKSGLRKTSEPRMGPPNAMIAIAKAATDEESRAAAEYFASFAFKPWIRVVEAATVPKTRVSGMLVPITPPATEPIGQRIIEVPEDPARTELRDPRSGFIAYVPPGSIKKGEELATTGGDDIAGGRIVRGRTIQCAICHGEGLKGLGDVPAIAGRSPSYLVRQLYDMQKGNRNGPGAQLMKAVVKDLTLDDMIAIAAYTASQTL